SDGRARRSRAPWDPWLVWQGKCAKLQSRRELRGRLAHEQARALLDLLECQLDGAVVVPVEDEPLARSSLDHGRVPLLAVVPAEDTLAALPRVELDVVRKPLLELVGIRQRFPHLVRRDGKHDLAGHFHDSSNPQPVGCVYWRNLTVAL